MIIRWSSHGWVAAIAGLFAGAPPRRRIVLVPCEPLVLSLGRELREPVSVTRSPEAGFMAELGSSWTDVIRLPATCPPLDMPKGLGRGYFLPGASRAD